MNNIVYSFGDYQLDAGRRQLSHQLRGPIPVASRAFDTLLHLVQNAGQLVGKRELMKAVWGDSVVEENNLTQTISTLRQLLGEQPGEHRFIVTAPGRGYRFVAEVVASVSGARPTTPGETPGQKTTSPSVATRPSARRRWVVALVAGAAIVLAAIAWIAPHNAIAPPAARPTIRTLAVLPFRPLVPGMSDPALELGMADTLITRLGGGSIVVRPLSSVRKYADLEQDPLAAGRELAVDAVLEGSIQRAGDTLRVTTRLIRVPDGASLWKDKLDQRWSSVFEVQDALAERVANALALVLTDAVRQRLTRRETQSRPAYQLYLLGRYHLYKLTPPEIAKGIQYFREAIALDPNYALSFAGLAEAYRALAITSDQAPNDALPQGKAAALKALAMSPDLDAAWASLCFIQMWSDWDWSGAEDSCKRAIAIDPSNADGHRAYAVLLSDLGRHEQAMAEARRASRLDPLSPLTNALEGHVLLYAGRDNDALRQLRATLDLEPNFWITHLMLGKVHLARGQLAEALSAFQRAETLSFGNSEAISLIGYTLAQRGDRAGAERAIETLTARAPARFLPAFNVAMIYNGLGDRDAVMRWLDQAYIDRDVRLTFLKIETKWNPMRTDPRFAALVRKLRLE